MRWQATAMPPSAAALLNKARAGHKGRGREFSRTQEFVAGLYWFTTLPLEARLDLIHAFRALPVPQDRHVRHTDISTACGRAPSQVRGPE
jgi:hypothetical protein